MESIERVSDVVKAFYKLIIRWVQPLSKESQLDKHRKSGRPHGVMSVSPWPRGSAQRGGGQLRGVIILSHDSITWSGDGRGFLLMLARILDFRNDGLGRKLKTFYSTHTKPTNRFWGSVIEAHNTLACVLTAMHSYACRRSQLPPSWNPSTRCQRPERPPPGFGCLPADLTHKGGAWSLRPEWPRSRHIEFLMRSSPRWWKGGHPGLRPRQPPKHF